MDDALPVRSAQLSPTAVPSLMSERVRVTSAFSSAKIEFAWSLISGTTRVRVKTRDGLVEPSVIVTCWPDALALQMSGSEGPTPIGFKGRVCAGWQVTPVPGMIESVTICPVVRFSNRTASSDSTDNSAGSNWVSLTPTR